MGVGRKEDNREGPGLYKGSDRATRPRRRVTALDQLLSVCRPSREPEVADNVKFWPAELDPVSSKVSGISRKSRHFLLLKISRSHRTQTFADVFRRCKKIEKSKGQTTKKPA